MAKQADWLKVQVRMPPELHAEIKAFAESEDYSMNGAILSMLSGMERSCWVHIY